MKSTTQAEFEDHEPNGAGSVVERRTAIKAAMWSVPVVAVAVSAPLAAASTPGGIELLNAEFEDVEIGDTIPLVFSLEGLADGAAASAEITVGDSVATLLSSIVEVEDETAVFLAEVLASGTFQVSITAGGLTRTFNVTVTTA